MQGRTHKVAPLFLGRIGKKMYLCGVEFKKEKEMEAVAQIQRLGSDLGVSIPRVIVNELSLKEGLFVNIQGNGNRIIIETVKPDRSYNLSDMLSKITENNTHQYIDTGEPIGNEIW